MLAWKEWSAFWSAMKNHQPEKEKIYRRGMFFGGVPREAWGGTRPSVKRATPEAWMHYGRTLTVTLQKLRLSPNLLCCDIR